MSSGAPFLELVIRICFQAPTSNSIPLEQGSSSHEHHSKRQEFRMVPLPDLIKPDVLNLETSLSILDMAPIQMIPTIEPCVCVNYPAASLLSQPQLDLPIFPECQDLAPESIDFNFVSMFKNKEASGSESKPTSLTRPPSSGINGNAHFGKKEDRGNHTTISDSFFDEFPTDMFDHLEPLPTSTECFFHIR